MIKIYKIFWVSLAILLFFVNGLPVVQAIGLEIPYPTLKTGAQLTSSSTVPQYFQYIFDFGMGIGFLVVMISLIIGGAFYLFSFASPEAKAQAKDKIYGALMGLAILLLTYLIIVTINPNLATLKLSTPEKPPEQPQILPLSDGVYLFKSMSDCNNFSNSTDTSSANQQNNFMRITTRYNNIGDYKNKTDTIKIVHDMNGDTRYIAILYQNIDFTGRCKYINPSVDTCQSVEKFANSASVYEYSFAPTGNGITFYRKPAIGQTFNQDGGYLTINNSRITVGRGNSAAFVEKLSNLRFTGNGGQCTVPEKEQKCIQWDTKGNCLKRECPTLSDGNISAIKIDGEYMVMLIYYDESLPGISLDKWAYCQEFPTYEDDNKIGPLQLKWEYIMNGERYPNYLLIFPIKRPV